MRLSLLCDPKNEMLFEFEEIDIVENRGGSPITEGRLFLLCRKLPLDFRTNV